MSEKIGQFVDYLNQGKQAEAGEVFKDALRAKVADSLDAQRADVAGKIFNTEPQSFSDPKPVVTDPGERTDVIMDTEGKPIEFTPNENEQPTPTAEVPTAPVSDESKPTT